MKRRNPALGIYSRTNFLGPILKEKLDGKGVGVVSFDTLISVDYSNFDYLVLEILDNPGKVFEINKVLSICTCKIVLLFPASVEVRFKDGYEKALKDLLSISDNLRVVLVPEVIGKGVKYNESYLSHSLIKQSIFSERIKINSSEKINLVSINSLSSVVIKELFSFGTDDRIVGLTGYKRTANSILKNYLKIKESDFIYVENKNTKTELRVSNTKKVVFSLRSSINNTKKSFLENIIVNKKSLEEPVPKKNIKRSYSKLLYQFFTIVLGVLFSPLVF